MQHRVGKQEPSLLQTAIMLCSLQSSLRLLFIVLRAKVQMHHKINGTYGTARALFEVLPSALRYSRTPAELQSRLQDGGVYFVDIIVCQALYRHKTTFPLLQQRLDKIKLEESIKEANRKKY